MLKMDSYSPDFLPLRYNTTTITGIIEQQATTMMSVVVSMRLGF